MTERYDRARNRTPGGIMGGVQPASPPSHGRSAGDRLRGLARSTGIAVGAVRGSRPRRVTPPEPGGGLGRGGALRGTVWAGGDSSPYDGVVLVGPEGRI